MTIGAWHEVTPYSVLELFNVSYDARKSFELHDHEWGSERFSFWIEQCKVGTKPIEATAYRPTAEADCESAYRAFRELEFPLLADFSSRKDSDIKDVMCLIQIDDEIAENPTLTDVFAQVVKPVSANITTFNLYNVSVF